MTIVLCFVWRVPFNFFFSGPLVAVIHAWNQIELFLGHDLHVVCALLWFRWPSNLLEFVNHFAIILFSLQGSADSNYSQPSSDLSLDDEREALRRETERLALAQLEKARVSCHLNNNYKNSLQKLITKKLIKFVKNLFKKFKKNNKKIKKIKLYFCIFVNLFLFKK